MCYWCRITSQRRFTSPATRCVKIYNLFCGLTTSWLKLSDNSSVYLTACAVHVSVTSFHCHILSQIRLKKQDAITSLGCTMEKCDKSNKSSQCKMCKTPFGRLLFTIFMLYFCETIPILWNTNGPKYCKVMKTELISVLKFNVYFVNKYRVVQYNQQ